MSHPYFDEPENPKLPKPTRAQRIAKFKEELWNDPVSGVSLLHRPKHAPETMMVRENVFMRAFDDLLMRQPLLAMLQPLERHADGDAGCEMETLYHPVLRNYMAEMRKVLRVTDLLRRATIRWKHLSKTICMEQYALLLSRGSLLPLLLEPLVWMTYCLLCTHRWFTFRLERKRARALMWRMNKHSRHSKQYHAIRVWQRTAANWGIIPATEIQRTYRGHLARRYVAQIHLRDTSVVTIQAFCRGIAPKAKYVRALAKRHTAAIEIQVSVICTLPVVLG